MSPPDHESALAPLHVERTGEGSGLVLVHGFTQTGASWRPIAQLMAGAHEILMPDLPGHGGSPQAVGDLAAAGAQLGEACGRASYVGYSLGARICLHLALGQPELVERLVLVSATAGIEDADERDERLVSDNALAQQIEDGGDAGIPGFVDEWLSRPLFAQLSEEAADRTARLSNTAAGLASSLRCHGTGTQLPLWERLGELTMPILVIAGEEDQRFVASSQRLAAAIGPNALLLLVPTAGHGAPFERPEAFARLIADFVAGETGPASSPELA
ncbi:MAG: alpha/beta fold hydrolase [Acidimicrobiales bacterium]